jgi:Fe-S cluster biogenesis protein NfuA
VADLKSRVAARLAEMAPYLARSGALTELIGIEDGVAQLKVWLTRPGASRLVASLQVKNGIERALRDAIPELRGVEAINLPPHTLIGWDQPGFAPVELPKV